MRIKKINSINYGGKVIGIGLIFMLLQKLLIDFVAKRVRGLKYIQVSANVRDEIWSE